MTSFLFVLTLLSSYPVTDRLSVGARGKTRFRYVEAGADSITGIHGERLAVGPSLAARLDLEAVYAVTEGLDLGAALRISNEESEGTLFAPDLVSTDVVGGWWWARYRRGTFDATIGAFDLSFTSLTLMRWDPSDSPLGSGGSCCAVAVGGLRGESLEELTEDYRLEGAKLELTPGPVEAVVAAARTTPASGTDHYAQYLGGARVTYGCYCPWARRSAEFGATFARVVDDDRSVVEPLGSDPVRSDVAGIDVDFPVLDRLALVGEFAYSMRDDNTLLLDPELLGSGVAAGIRVGDRETSDAQLQYVRSDRDFMPLMRALSVPRDRQGVRASLARRRIGIGSALLSLSGYAKFQQEFEPLEGAEFTGGRFPGRFWIATASIGIEPWYGTHFEAIAEWRRNSRRDDPATTAHDELLDATEAIGSVVATYKFTFQSSVRVKYSLVSHTEPGNSYLAHMPSIEVGLKF